MSGMGAQVDFITFCCPKDKNRLYAPSELANRVRSHGYPFNTVRVVWQRIDDFPSALDYAAFPNHRIHRSQDYPKILSSYGMSEHDAIADDYTHGPTAAHYWKWHVINHLIGMRVSRADYVVFSDSDCRMQSQPQRSWVDVGIEILKAHKDILIVSPGDGGSMCEQPSSIPGVKFRLTRNVSQQLFLCDRRVLSSIDFAVPWNWEVIAPGGPMQEYYYMLEGRIWRYMNKTGMWRAILPDTWRYWHDQW